MRLPPVSAQQMLQGYRAEVSRQFANGASHGEFGLPLNRPCLESPREREARLERVENVLRAALEAAVRQVGRKDTVRLFDKHVRQSSRGKQPDEVERQFILNEFDAEVVGGADRAQAVQRIAAKTQRRRNRGSLESTLRHVRRVLKEREDARARTDAFYQAALATDGLSLLSEAMQRFTDK